MLRILAEENILLQKILFLVENFPGGNFLVIKWLELHYLTATNLGPIPDQKTWGTKIPQAMQYSRKTQSWFLQQESDFKSERCRQRYLQGRVMLQLKIRYVYTGEPRLLGPNQKLCFVTIFITHMDKVIHSFFRARRHRWDVLVTEGMSALKDEVASQG